MIPVERRKNDPYLWLNALVIVFLGVIAILVVVGSFYLAIIDKKPADWHGNIIFGIIGVLGGFLSGRAVTTQTAPHVPAGVVADTVKTVNVSSPENTGAGEKDDTVTANNSSDS